jgi:acid phosphatase (class A)
MNLNSWLSLVVLFVFTATSGALAAPKYLPADCTALVDLLPPPPTNGSPAALADLETVLRVQADRTPDQIKRAKRVASQSVMSFGQPVLGEWFTAKNLPRTQALFAEIDKESQSIVDAQVKKRYLRTRPYIFSPEVKPIVGRPDNTSYPSGHSAAAALWGTLLSAAFPERAAEFKTEIREAMWCRVLGGAHYPSDTVAGQMLGEAIAQAMLKSPAMQEALAIIQAEVVPFCPSVEREVSASRATN